MGRLVRLSHRRFRFVIPLAVLGALVPRTVSASPSYPAQVVKFLALTCDGGQGDLPVEGCSCMLCHTTCAGQGAGNANQPFALSMRDDFGLVPESFGSLDDALTQMSNNNIASASHCFDDIDMLKSCQNPNVAASLDAGYCPHPSADSGVSSGDGGGGSDGGTPMKAFVPPVVSVPLQPPVYGCVGTVSPVSTGGDGSWLACLGIVSAAVTRRYRRRGGL
jgi:hypothetical protein